MSRIGGLDLIALTFAAFNILRIVSYLPQIIAVARDQHGATAISFSCWTIWVCANVSTGLYAWDRLGDVSLVLISAFNAACCITVLALAAYKRTARRVGMKAPHDSQDQSGKFPYAKDMDFACRILLLARSGGVIRRRSQVTRTGDAR